MPSSVQKLVGKKEQVRDFVLSHVANGVRTGEKIWSEHELARRLGVSKSTVRKAIEEMEAAGVLVQRQGKGTFIRDAGHPLVKAMRQQKSRVLALVSPLSQNDAFMHDITLGVEEALDQDRYLLVNKHMHMPACAEEDMLDKLAETVGGIILFSTMTPPAREKIADLCERRFPLVLIDRYAEDISCAVVCTDNEDGGMLATQYLLDLGHRRIMFVMYDDNFSSTLSREAGYRCAMRRAAGAIPQVVVLPRTSGDAEHLPLLSSGDRTERPTAIFAANDATAIDCYRFLRGQNVRVPEDISLVGFDDNPDAAMLDVPLTTVAQPKHQMGYKAAKMLQAILDGKDEPVRRFFLQPRLVLRTSTATAVQVT